MPALRTITMLACAALAAAAGCTAEVPEAARGRDVVRPVLGFAIDVPDGWTWSDVAGDVVLEIVRRPSAETGEGGAGGEAARPKRSHPVVHVVVVDREGVALEGWAEEAVAESKDFQADLGVAGRKAARLTDGHPALALTLRRGVGRAGLQGMFRFVRGMVSRATGPLGPPRRRSVIV